ncbi:MAG: hypothetical protein ACOVKV_02555, partial [Novosphingobium sp.]
MAIAEARTLSIAPLYAKVCGQRTALPWGRAAPEEKSARAANLVLVGADARRTAGAEVARLVAVLALATVEGRFKYWIAHRTAIGLGTVTTLLTRRDVARTTVAALRTTAMGLAVAVLTAPTLATTAFATTAFATTAFAGTALATTPLS